MITWWVLFSLVFFCINFFSLSLIWMFWRHCVLFIIRFGLGRWWWGWWSSIIDFFFFFSLIFLSIHIFYWPIVCVVTWFWFNLFWKLHHFVVVFDYYFWFLFHFTQFFFHHFSKFLETKKNKCYFTTYYHRKKEFGYKRCSFCMQRKAIPYHY